MRIGFPERVKMEDKYSKQIRITVSVYDPEEVMEEQPVWEPIEIMSGSVDAINWEVWDRLYVTDSKGNRWMSEDQGGTWRRIGRWRWLSRIKEWVNQKLYEWGR